MREIIFYKTLSGHCPVEDFIDSLSAKHAKRVTWVMRLVQDFPVIPSNYFKKLVNTDDIWEIRVKSGNNIFRILGFFDGPKLLVLDYAFQKKTQKTPVQTIKTAEVRKRDYFKRRKIK